MTTAVQERKQIPMNKKLLILGGYGNTGKLIARLLLEQTNSRLILAGRTIERAESFAAQLNSEFDGNRVSSAYVDASDSSSVKAVIQQEGVDLLLAASSTSEYTKEVAQAALDTRCDYFDIQFSNKKVVTLKGLEAEMKQSEVCFITDGGFHPGLPAALIRYAAENFFDEVKSAIVGSVIQVDRAANPRSESTMHEFTEELSGIEATFFKDGQWKKPRMWGMFDMITMDFGKPFGKCYCFPMFLEEMQTLPTVYPTLTDTGFFVGGFNWFVDWLLLPAFAVQFILPNVTKNCLAKLLDWGLNTFFKTTLRDTFTFGGTWY